MNLTALPDGRAARDSQRPQRVLTVADRVPNGARASRGNRGNVAELEPAYAHQGNSPTSAPVNGDHLQADYFLRLLIPGCREIDRKIDQHQKAIAVAEARGAAEDAHRIRRMLHIDEEERQTLKALIDGLQRRFPVPPRG
jgi:hypothetical protein